MKTQILHLEPHDDIISARDKMGWGQAGRILLVWPGRGQVLHRSLDLSLLQRHSQSINAQLGLVTRNPEVRFHARQLGIPVFRSVRQAQKAPWRRRRARQRRRLQPPPERGDEERLARADLEALREMARPAPPAWAQKPLVRLLIFSLGSLAVLAIAAVLLPGARLTLDPHTQTQETSFTVQASSAVDSLGPSGTLPMRPVRVSVEGRGRLATTGSIRLPDQAATGLARFTNLTDQEIRLPEGTVIRTQDTPPVRFVTTAAGLVPPGPTGSLQLPIKALTPGSSGNLPAGSLRAIEGSFGPSLAVTNPTGTRGGTDTTAPAPSSADRRRLYNQLAASLADTARAELANLPGSDDRLLDDSLEVVEVLEESYEPTGAAPADFLQLTLRLELEGQVIRGEDLRSLVSAVLDNTLPAGFGPQPETLRIQSLNDPAMSVAGSERLARWRVQAERQLVAVVKSAQAVNLALGLPPAEAQQRLSTHLTLDRPPQITLTPAWWPRLPILPFRVDVQIDESQGLKN